MNLNLVTDEVQNFITEHLTDAVTKIALSKSPFKNIEPRELAEQIDGRKRSEKKLPHWFSTPKIFFPPKLSIEQSSSELTAEYKSRLAKGDALIDLTGGFGVDAYYFAKKCSKVIHCEQNLQLSEIVEYNSKLLGIENIEFINSDSLTYLLNDSAVYDTIYIDPSRRIQTQKVFLLKDTEPDVVSNLPLLLSKASKIIIKTSPLFDIQSGLKELSNVREVHVVSVKNDCKELLWIVDKDFTGEPIIVCAALKNHLEDQLTFKLSDEKNLTINQYSPPLQYLYEPDVALLKAGCFKSITRKFDVIKLHSNTHLYTSDKLSNIFVGKKFKVLAVAEYKDFLKEISIKKANVICRNFPYTPDQVKKKHKLIDGGADYLFFTTVVQKGLVVIHAVVF